VRSIEDLRNRYLTDVMFRRTARTMEIAMLDKGMSEDDMRDALWMATKKVEEFRQKHPSQYQIRKGTSNE